MQKLEEEFYPNLSIIAGTIATKKHIKDPIKLKQYEKYYEEYGWVKDTELANDDYFTKEKKKFEQLLEAPKTGIDVLRNTCYIFSNRDIWRHDKITPFKEEKDSALRQSTVLQPGNKNNNHPYCELIHPFTKEKISIGIEICREHGLGVLKKMSSKKPILHFVLSATAPIDLDNVYGEYVVHLDINNRPKLILTKNTNIKTLPIHFYKSNLLENNHHLSGPLQPLYPFEKQIYDKLDELITHSQGEIKKITEEFRIIFASGNSNIALHDRLKFWLERNEHILLKENTNTPTTLFATEFSIKKWIQEIRDIMTYDLNQDLDHLDYLSKNDALPLYPLDLFNHYLQKEKYDSALNCLIADNQLLTQIKLDFNQARMLLGIIINFGPERTDREMLCELVLKNIGDMITNPISKNDDKTLLHTACEMNLQFIFNLLLPYFIDKIDQADKKQNTPLHLAVKNHAELEIIINLLKNGANPDHENNDTNHKTPRHLAEATYPEAAELIRGFRKTLAM